MTRRPGFTITELLVSFALILFIMTILTEAFSAGLESFRRLKAIGDMQARMRAAATWLRNDLGAEHFDDGARYLRDIDLRIGQGSPPTAGYFRIWQRSISNSPTSLVRNSTIDEGVTRDNLPSTISTDHVLAFTVRLRGNLPSDYFTATLPGLNALNENKLGQQPPIPIDLRRPGVGQSQWAEVVYFLQPKTNRLANGTQLYALYRRQRILADSDDVYLTNDSRYHAVSAYVVQPPDPNAGMFRVNTSRSITEPCNRFGAADTLSNTAGIYAAASAATPFQGWSLENNFSTDPAGDDLLLTDVISFDIKVIQEGYSGAGGEGAVFMDLPPANTSRNAALAGYSVFDTWSKQGLYANLVAGIPAWEGTGTPEAVPLRLRILALQITIRVWDDKSEQARQLTIIQDM